MKSANVCLSFRINENVCYYSQFPQFFNYSYIEKTWLSIVNLLKKHEVVKMTHIKETVSNASFQSLVIVTKDTL